jgi:hypothetical protein
MNVPGKFVPAASLAADWSPSMVVGICAIAGAASRPTDNPSAPIVNVDLTIPSLGEG